MCVCVCVYKFCSVNYPYDAKDFALYTIGMKQTKLRRKPLAWFKRLSTVAVSVKWLIVETFNGPCLGKKLPRGTGDALRSHQVTS